MSAVASVRDISSVADPGLGLARPSQSVHAMEAAEMNRWMIWFGSPVIVAAIFVGVTFETGRPFWLAGTIASIIVDIFVLVWLALSSDTNGLIGEAAHH